MSLGLVQMGQWVLRRTAVSIASAARLAPPTVAAGHSEGVQRTQVAGHGGGLSTPALAAKLVKLERDVRSLRDTADL